MENADTIINFKYDFYKFNHEQIFPLDSRIFLKSLLNLSENEMQEIYRNPPRHIFVHPFYAYCRSNSKGRRVTHLKFFKQILRASQESSVLVLEEWHNFRGNNSNLISPHSCLYNTYKTLQGAVKNPIYFIMTNNSSPYADTERLRLAILRSLKNEDLSRYIDMVKPSFHLNEFNKVLPMAIRRCLGIESLTLHGMYYSLQNDGTGCINAFCNLCSGILNLRPGLIYGFDLNKAAADSFAHN